jgi:hypothetical protein
MNQRSITLGEKLFQFGSMAGWIRTAPTLFTLHKVTSSDVTCVDQMGRICTMGRHFARAGTDSAYPIEVFITQTDEAAAAPEKGQS